MTSAPLPVPLQRFLSDCIDSVEQVEILAVMHGTARWWTARELASEIYLSPAGAARELERLAGRGLLEVHLGTDLLYRVSALSQSQAQAISALMDVYPTHRVEILGHIIATKGRALRHFAEAFRFRKDDRSG